jgi:type I site-specific restriction-modification system R (restriction) subunit
VDKLSADIQAHFADTGQIGKKYLVNHSAGSGKTLTISWLAERLHSLYKTGSSIKLVDMVFVLTDRTNLDNNVRDELDCFNHLAAQIISYETLYHLHSPLVPNTDEEEKIYPKGIVSKLLKQVAFEDDGLITVN